MIDKRQVMYDIERCISHVPDACRDCSHYTGTVGFECMENLMSDALTLLKEQELVVRCKDCKHRRFHPYEKIPYCGKHSYGWGWKDDDFCSHAERR